MLDEIRGNVSVSPMFLRETSQLSLLVVVAPTTGGLFYCLSSVVVYRFTLHAGSRKTEEVRLVPVVHGAKPCTQRVALKGNTRAWAIGRVNNPTLRPLPQIAGRLVGTSSHGPALKGQPFRVVPSRRRSLAPFSFRPLILPRLQ